MAFFQLVLKAHRLEKLRRRYEDEKLRSIELSKGAKTLTWSQRLRRKKLRCKRKVKDFWSKITSFPEDSWLHKKAVLLRTDGSFENYILKSVFGFLGGILLTYIFFIFFVFQLNFSLTSATLLCSVIGVILTLGLAFSYGIRCIVFLLLPQFFSKRGRQALIAYAFILTLTGPGKNALRNISVLTESLICGQEQLKEAVKSVIDLIKEPFYALKEAIMKVIGTVRVIVRKIRETLVAIKRVVVSILKVITAVFQWLGSIVNICNKKLGTPFDRCQRVFEGAVADCRAKLGPIFGGICNLTYIVGALCWIVKPLDFICMLVSYVADAIVGAVKKKIRRFTMHMKTMFYVKVKFSHSYHFETNRSQTIEDISGNIAAEIRSRTRRFLAVFDWVNFLTAFFILFMLLRVLHYRHKWLTNERFDNRYLTNDLRTIDLIRARQEKETILPLNARERNRYISLSSITLIKTEKIRLAKSFIFLSLTTIKICIHMMADYSLFWILDTIRYHGRIETKIQQPNSVGVHVSGTGYLAELYRSIVKTFTPNIEDIEINSTPCLPDPIPPDFDGYTRILSLIIFCWIMTIFEPYSLRLRHIVMCQYHPDRAKQRAAWLYNHIMRSRGSFVKFARRQLRRKFGINNEEQVERITMKQRLMSVCPFLNICFPQKENACLVCGAVQLDDNNPHIKCPTPGCVGLFCTQCFADLQNICTICRSPLEYGDLSDMSEEIDSSDDQVQVTKEKKLKLAKEMKKKKKKIEEEIEEDEEDIEEMEVEDYEEVEEFEKDDRVMEKLEKRDVRQQTDDEELEDSDERSSTSDYSYTYQDEVPPPETEVHQRLIPFKDVEAHQRLIPFKDVEVHQRLRPFKDVEAHQRLIPFKDVEVHQRLRPFKDVEAQRIRDDVTIQIFNDPIARSITWSSDTTPSCFVVRAHRKVRRRLKNKTRESPVRRDSSSSEEIKEDEVIHIEVDDDDSRELLIRDKRDEGKSSRVKRIIAAVSRIPWLGGRGKKRLQPRRPSLMNRIIEMLNGKRSISPVQTYRRIRSKKSDVEEASTSSSISFSYSEDDDDDRLTNGSLEAKRIERHVEWEDPEDIISAKNYEQNKVSRRTKMDDINLRHPCEKKFATKDLPRYLEPISKSTSYYEIDETEDSRSSYKYARKGEDINALSDARTSSDSRRTDTWNIIGEDQSQNSTPHASERALQEILNRIEKKNTKNQDSPTTSEKSEETFVPKNETDRRASKNYDKNLHKEIERSAMRQERKKQKDAAQSVPRKRLKKVQLYDPLAGLELYAVEDKAKRSDKYSKKRMKDEEEKQEDNKKEISKINKNAPLHPHEVIRDKVNVGTSVIDQNKGVQTKPMKSKKMIKKDVPVKMKKLKNDKSKQVHHGNEWKERQWKKCIEEYKKRHRRQTKKGPSDSDSKRHRKKHDFKGKSMIIDKLYLKRKSHKKDKTGRRRMYDEALQFPEDERKDWHERQSFHSKDPQRQFISGFIPIMYPEHLQSYQRYYDSHERDYLRTSRPERASIYQPHDSQICQRETYDNKSSYSHDYPRDEADQTETFHADEDTSYCSDEHTTTCTDSKRSSSEEDLRPVSKQYKQDVHSCTRKMCKAASPPEKFHLPALKKYLPMYQKSQLIEELKEHDKIRLIREREARRCVTSNPIESTKLPFVKMKEQSLSDTFVDCDREHHCQLLQATRNEKLPYQETQAFKQLTKEFRKRTLSTKRGKHFCETEPLISASRNADKSKEVEQLFPAKRKCRRDNFVSNFTNRIANAFKSTHPRKCVRKSPDVRQVTRGKPPSDVSSSADDTTDNNEVTW